jgi:molybdopterin-binding protein
MDISARNQLKGSIKTIRLGDIMAEIVMVLWAGNHFGHHQGRS